MNGIPPGAHLFGVPPQVAQPKTERTVRFRSCRMGFVVNVGPAGTVAGYEMQIIDPQEETVYVFGLDQALRDTFVDQLRSLPDEGTIPGGDNGSAA